MKSLTIEELMEIPELDHLLSGPDVDKIIEYEEEYWESSDEEFEEYELKCLAVVGLTIRVAGEYLNPDPDFYWEHIQHLIEAVFPGRYYMVY